MWLWHKQGAVWRAMKICHSFTDRVIKHFWHYQNVFTVHNILSLLSVKHVLHKFFQFKALFFFKLVKYAFIKIEYKKGTEIFKHTNLSPSVVLNNKHISYYHYIYCIYNNISDISCYLLQTRPSCSHIGACCFVVQIFGLENWGPLCAPSTKGKNKVV